MRIFVAAAAAAFALLAGTAAFASNGNTRCIKVTLPNGSVAHIRYVGKVAPRVTIEPKSRRPLARAEWRSKRRGFSLAATDLAGRDLFHPADWRTIASDAAPAADNDAARRCPGVRRNGALVPAVLWNQRQPGAAVDTI